MYVHIKYKILFRHPQDWSGRVRINQECLVNVTWTNRTHDRAHRELVTLQVSSNLLIPGNHQHFKVDSVY
jgi:hypothetical protein